MNSAIGGSANGGAAATANALKSATTTVNVSAATAPTAEQVLTATDSTHATWRTPATTTTLAVTTANFDKVNATLANVTGLTATLVAGRTYSFVATLPMTADATGGWKAGLAGTATVTALWGAVDSYDYDSNTVNAENLYSSGPFTTVVGSRAGPTSTRVTITGTVVVNAGGTLLVQFAQSSASGTSTILRGATLITTT